MNVAGEPLKFEASISDSELNATINRIEAGIKGMEDVARSAESSFDALSSKVKSIHVDMATIKADIDGVSASERMLKKALKDNIITESDYIQKTAELGARRHELTTKLKEYRIELSKVAQEQNKVAQSNVPQSTSSGITIPSPNISSEFDSSIKGIKDLADAAQSSFNALSDQAKELHVDISTVRAGIDEVAASERELKKSLNDNALSESDYIQKTAELGAKRQDLTTKLREYRAELERVTNEEKIAVQSRPYTSADTAFEVANQHGSEKPFIPLPSLTAIEELKQSMMSLEAQEESLSKSFMNGSISSQEFEKAIEGVKKGQERLVAQMAQAKEGEFSDWSIISKDTKEQIDTISSLNDKLKELKSTASETEIGDGLNKINQDIEKLEEEIKRATQAGKVGFDAFGFAIEESKQAIPKLQTELRGLIDEMARMRAGGKVNTKEYDDLKLKASELKKAIQDVNMEIKAGASRTGNLDNAVRSVQTLTAAYSIAQSASMLLGGKNEDLQKQLMKVAAAMSLLQGLQTIQNELKRADSIFTVAQTAAQRAYAIAVGTSTGAMKLFRLALIGTGVGALVVGIAMLIQYMAKLRKETEAAASVQKEYNEAMKGTPKSAGDARIELVKMSEQIRLAKEGKIDATKVLKTYNETLGKTMGAASDLNSAEQIIVKNGEAYIQMMLAKAKATVVAELAAKQYAKVIEAEMKNDEVFIGVNLTTGESASDDQLAGIKKEAEKKNAVLIDQEKNKYSAFELLLKEHNEDVAKIASSAGLNQFGDTGKGDKEDKSIQVEENKRQALLNKLDDMNTDYLRKSMTKDEQETQSIIDKYAKVRREIEQFNATAKKVDKINVIEFDKVAKVAVDDVLYRQDTKLLSIELDKQRKLYQEFEDFKKATSEEAAIERFESEKSAFDDYGAYVQSEMDKLNKETIGREMTGGEKARLKVLEDDLKAHNSNKRKIETAYLVEVYQSTLSNEQKIVDLKEKYIKEEKSLREKYKGNDLEDRLKVSSDNAAKDFSDLFNSIISEEKKFEDLGNMLAGATKDQIRAQIKSLQNYLKGATDLTEDQVKRLNGMITSLQKALPTATNDGGSGGIISRGSTELDDLANEATASANRISELNRQIDLLKNKDGVIPPEAVVKAQQLQAEIEGINSRLRDIDGEALGALASVFGDIGSQVKELASDLEGLNEGLFNTLNIIGDIADIGSSGLGGIANILKGIEGIKDLGKSEGGLLGGIKGLFSKDAENGGGLLGGLSSIASIAGPIGKGVALIGKAVGGVVKHFKAIKESEVAARKAMDDFYNAAKQGELEYQALLRKRDQDDVKRGKTTYQGIVAQLELLKSQSPELKKAYDDVFAALQNSEFVSGIGYKHSTWFRKAKTWDIMSSLSGKDYEALEKLDLDGKLTGKAKEDFQTLKGFRDELKEAGVDIEDLQAQLEEMLTGTSVEGLSNALADLFANGKNAAQDFGKSFEEILKGAIVNSFKYQYLERQMQPLFDFMTEATKDGIVTQDEIDKARKMSQSIADNAQAYWDNLTKLTDIDFSDKDDSSSPTRDTINRITETQADAITGTLKGIQVGIISNNTQVNGISRDLQNVQAGIFEGNSISRAQTDAMVRSMQLQLASSYKALEHLVVIRDNTGKTADNTSRLETMEISLKSIDSKMSNTDNAKRANGF